MSCFIQIVICYEAEPHLITLLYTPLSCAKRRMKVFFSGLLRLQQLLRTF